MDEDERERLPSPLHVADTSRKSDSAMSSPDGADTPATPPDPGKKDSEPQMGHTTALESPSSTVSPQRSVTSIDECLKARKRPAEESPESQILPQKPRSQLDPSGRHSPEFQPGAESVFDSSRASASTHPYGEELESEDKYVVHQAELAHLISLIKKMKNSETAGERASSTEALESSHVPPASQTQGGRWDAEVWKAAAKPKSAAASTGTARFEAAAEKIPSRENQPDALTVVKKENLSPGVAGNQNPGQDPQPLSAAATDGAAVCQRPASFTEVNGGHQSTPPVFAPASGRSGQCDRVSGSAEDAGASEDAPVCNASSHAPGALLSGA